MANEIRKPTANTVDAGISLDNPAQAYDTTSGGDETTNASKYNASDFTHRFRTWQATSETYTALTLYCKWGTSGGFSNDTFGIEYSLDGGSVWGNWLLVQALHNDAQWQTASAVLSAGQNLANIQVRVVFDKVGGGDKDTIYISDIWTDGVYAVATPVNFIDSLDLTSLTGSTTLGKRIDVVDALPLTSLTGDTILFRQNDYGDVLPLTSLTSDAALSINVNFADALPLTTLTSDAEFALGTIYNFANTLELTTLSSAVKVGLLTNFIDSLDLTTLSSDARLILIKVYADSLDVTTLTGSSALFRQTGFSDVLPLTTLTSDIIMQIGSIIDFADNLAPTTLTSDAKMSLSKTFADVLGLTTLTSDAILFRLTNFTDMAVQEFRTSDDLPFLTSDQQFNVPSPDTITTLTSEPILSGLQLIFATTLNLTTSTSAPILFRLTDYVDSLDLTSLTSDLGMSLFTDFLNSLDITTLTSNPILSGLFELTPINVYVVNAEGRIIIPLRDNIKIIDAANRIHTVPADTTLTVPAESRTYEA